jgi:branched-chain amino acid transport system substrate-binding protein
MVVLAFWNTARADQQIRIGHVAPLTGQSAVLGKDNENGARLAVEEINAKGLVVGGQKITLQLDAQDDEADPRIATQVAQKLVDDKVVAVIGHADSGTSIPASRIYHVAGIVQVSPSATNPAYTQQGFRTAYRVVATDAQQGPALAGYAARTLKAKTVAIVDDSTAYGQGLADEFEKTAKSLGLNVLSRDATNDKAVDFRAVLTKIKSEAPDTIMYGGMDATAGLFAKQARQLGMHASIVTGDGACTGALAELAGPASENVICSEVGLPLEKMSGGENFEANYERRFGHPVLHTAPLAYDAVYVVAAAMQRAHSTDPAMLVEAMSGTDYRGLSGEITFDSNGDLKHGVISLYGFRSGKKVLLAVVRT